jgi:leader peptidase (prepilin peptidase)/N-methyltransferase
MPTDFYVRVFEVFAFILGAVVGSFLNVCIYRLPRGLSVNMPTRSFCPECNETIPFSQNIPLFSWLALRGRCAKCGCKIPFRYFGVELLTACLFLAVWLKCWHSGEWILALPYWILVSLLVAATFIDFEHFIIPDEITWGGVGAGVVLSFAIPPLMGTEKSWATGLWSIGAAALGYLLLWGVVEMGKRMFGKKRVVIDPPEKFTWVRSGDDAELAIGEERMKWSELFSRETDELLLDCSELEFAGKANGKTQLQFFHNRVVLSGTAHDLEGLESFSGIATEVTIPREAMGFGDVKFIAAIGAFLGWKAVLFTVMGASVIGALVGTTGILLGKREWSARIPFGPYLALAALIWMFAGPQIITWYLTLLAPPLL